MRVKLLENVFGFPIGIKMIAEELMDQHISIKSSELLRIGVPHEEIVLDADTTWCFLPHEYEIVKPEFINCSDSNVGQGWEGYYDKFYGKLKK